MFKNLASSESLQQAMDIHDEIIRRRVIMNFRQEGMKTEQVLKGLEACSFREIFRPEPLLSMALIFTCQPRLMSGSSNSLPSTASSNSGSAAPSGEMIHYLMSGEFLWF